MSATATNAKIYCNRCKQTTNHRLVGDHESSESEEDPRVTVDYRYALWICAGCETGTLESSEGFEGSLGTYDEYGEPVWDQQFHPNRAQSHHSKKLFVKLKPKLTRIYRETIDCFNSGSLILCTAGLRALLEGICEDRRIKGKNLRDKINNLQPLLPNKNIIKSLHHFRFTGNQAVHQLEAASGSDTRLAIEVMEDLLNFLYELDYKASRLAASAKTKRRRPKVKAAGVPLSSLIDPPGGGSS